MLTQGVDLEPDQPGRFSDGFDCRMYGRIRSDVQGGRRFTIVGNARPAERGSKMQWASVIRNHYVGRFEQTRELLQTRGANEIPRRATKLGDHLLSEFPLAQPA